METVRSLFGSSIVNATHRCDVAQRPALAAVMPAMSREMCTPVKRVAESPCGLSPSSSSSSPPYRLCSKGPGPGLNLPMRDGQADALPETQDEEPRSFIDDIVETEAKHEESMDSRDELPPPTPRRLRIKQNAPWFAKRCSGTETVLPLLPTTVPPELTMPLWQANKKARCQFAVMQARERKKDSGTTYDEVFRTAHRGWSLLDDSVKETFLTMVANTGGLEAQVKVSTPLTNSVPLGGQSENSLAYSCGSLQTWNGPWFLDDDAYVKMVNEWQAIPHILEKHVKAYPGIQELFEEFLVMVLVTKERFKLRDWSCCLELSLQAKDLGRLRFHCFLDRSCREDHAWSMWSTMLEEVSFQGAV